MKKDEKFWFVVQTEDDKIFICTKEYIDDMIKHFEISDEEIDFKTIAKIKFDYTIDLSVHEITWFEQIVHEKSFVDRVVLALVENRLKP